MAAQTVVNVSKIKQGEVAAAIDDLGQALTGAGTAVLSMKLIKGTTTNDSATALYVGEHTSITVLSGAAVVLTSPATSNVSTLSLTAGDWDLYGNVLFVPAATTSITILKAGFSTTTATLPTAPGSGGYAEFVLPAFVPTAAGAPSLVFRQRLSIAATTSVFMVAAGTFTVAALSAYGFFGARRVR